MLMQDTFDHDGNDDDNDDDDDGDDDDIGTFSLRLIQFLE